MNILLCILGPSLVSIRVFSRLNKNQLLDKNILFYYLLFLFVNNFFAGVFSILLFGARTSIDNSLVNFPIFALKYIIIAVIIAIFAPFIFKIVSENLDYSIEVVKNEKRKKTRKSKNSK